MEGLYDAIIAAAESWGIDVARAKLEGENTAPWYEEEGDFRGPDGTLVCGTCGMPKETEPDETTGTRFPIVHRHQLGTMARRPETAEEREQRIERNRARCFAGEFADLVECRFEATSPTVDRRALDEARTFAAGLRTDRQRHHGGKLVLFGAPGMGKTWLACCVANAAVDGGLRAQVTSLRSVRAQVERSYGSEADTVEALCRNDLVVIDDLFRERGTEWARELSFTVIDALSKRHVAVVVTTNMSGQALYDPNDADRAIVERIKERAVRVHVEGQNQRQGRLR